MGRGWGESDGTDDVVMNKSLKTFSGERIPNLSIPQSKCAQVDVFFSVDAVNWFGSYAEKSAEAVAARFASFESRACHTAPL